MAASFRSIFLFTYLILLTAVAAADYYKVLGSKHTPKEARCTWTNEPPALVSRGASDSEIKKAYRKLSRAHHPDKGGSEETFAEIATGALAAAAFSSCALHLTRTSLAYEVLIDSEVGWAADEWRALSGSLTVRVALCRNERFMTDMARFVLLTSLRNSLSQVLTPCVGGPQKPWQWASTLQSV